MRQFEPIIIVGDKLMPAKVMAATLKGKASGKRVGNSRFGEKPEGALEKLHSLFRNEKWKGEKDFKYYLGLVQKEPENTFARLRLAEIRLKRGEKKKAIIVYLQTAEIFFRKRRYSQAIAICKRIHEQNPALMKFYPELDELCQKMGFQEEASSQSPQGMEESVTKGMGRHVVSKPRAIIEEIQEKKVQSSPGGAKAQAEKNGTESAGETGELASPAQEQKEALFDLSAQLEFIEPPEGKEAFEVTAEKSYGLEEIFRELRNNRYPGEGISQFPLQHGTGLSRIGAHNRKGDLKFLEKNPK